MRNLVVLLALAWVCLAMAAYAATHQVRVEMSGTERCIVSNGIPDHSVGQFPNAGNPHTILEQNISFCVTSQPVKGTTPQMVPTVGIAENGIIIRPGTADYYDASSRRGHSRDRSSGWNLDGMGPGNTLGLDQNNAHVDNRGIYHYHGVPDALVNVSQDSLIGWAADGFEIHYVGDGAKPSFALKRGTRPTAPGGTYDGTYNEDFEYVQNYGNLDQCNGAMTSTGAYVYFATDAYPFYPRCLWGTRITRFR
ncbi:MAG: YHYH protein [Pseudomonadota bacterium]